MSTPFIEENDQTRARREHLEELRELVGNVYPNKFERSHETGREDTITSIIEKFKPLEPQTLEGQRPTPEEIERANAELNKTEVRIAGRIATPPRVMGKAAFVHLSDGRERLQIYVRKADVVAINNSTGAPLDDPEAGWKLFNLLDHGDFIGVSGYLFITKTGELSVHVRELQFLAKALLPMPDKMHGIADPEIRQRQRYADLIAGSLKVDVEKDEVEGNETASRELSSREVFERRSKLITELRRFLDDHGYIEVETPMLTPLATGAAAKPFKTHHNALDIDLYARIAPELYLKRLLVGGFEKVYELNRNFRNEGIGYRWNPEFTMLEFYCAYMDVNGMMDFCEEMIRSAAYTVTGHTHAQWGEHEIDFSQRFERLSMKEAILKYWPSRFNRVPQAMQVTSDWLDNPKQVSFLTSFLNHLNLKGIDEFIEETTGKSSATGHYARELELSYWQSMREEVDKSWRYAEERMAEFDADPTASDDTTMGRGVAFIFEQIAEEKLVQPTFIHDFPKPISPLSKASPDNPTIAERFELFVAGMEIANGFSELNDPVEQRERFLEQMQQREHGDEEAMLLDEDYIRALSYGMPPAAGIGIGIDRLTMILTGKRSIRDVILFPHMRPERKAEAATEEAEGGDNTETVE